jgi:hypothetical protein
MREDWTKSFYVCDKVSNKMQRYIEENWQKMHLEPINCVDQVFYSLSSVFGSMTLCEIALKNEHNFMIGSLTFIGRTPLRATGSN